MTEAKMEFETYPHRHGAIILQEQKYRALWDELIEVIHRISEEDIINHFAAHYQGKQKSLSLSINALIRDRLTEKGWASQAPIFQGDEYKDPRWTLDFSKDNLLSVEVAFNHGEAMSWNLLKPALASELNHVAKKYQTEVGVVILATEEMKEAGGFDSAVGTYDKAQRYLPAMNNFLTAPMVLIGLQAPTTFRIKHVKQGSKIVGAIEMVE